MKCIFFYLRSYRNFQSYYTGILCKFFPAGIMMMILWSYESNRDLPVCCEYYSIHHLYNNSKFWITTGGLKLFFYSQLQTYSFNNLPIFFFLYFIHSSDYTYFKFPPNRSTHSLYLFRYQSLNSCNAAHVLSNIAQTTKLQEDFASVPQVQQVISIP